MLAVQALNKPVHIPKDLAVDHVRQFWHAIESETHSRFANLRRLARMDRAWFLLMLHGGLRSGEVRRLVLADIDWQNRRVRIEQSKGLKDRLVPLSESVLYALNDYLLVRGPAEHLPQEVFIHKHRPLGPRYCAIRLKNYGKRIGLKATPHQLRHTCATLLLNSGAPILTVQSILGHKHVDTTMGYARLFDGTLAADYYRAMSVIENRLYFEVVPDQQIDLGGLLAMLDTLRNGTLNDLQTETIHRVRAGLLAMAKEVT